MMDGARNTFIKLLSNNLVQNPMVHIYFKIGNKTVTFYKKCGIIYTTLDSETIRLSMGNTNEITKAAVEMILKYDKGRV